ncbi:tyrosine-type recombinase/integrase [Erysipelothrix sp. HDW6A]|uniref:tyrosine-type recombinase/integrase n=1 Tax=Erysipelothrix sp. HDW6A TaxID=2714928 RepID=UPI001409C243|nr:tyrosine-type recombinase/integrase [Erysipelothrix sp. HDW6A]QIK57805.1 tyrosine-type recombinase/integrase [Erysipelothrix sp. HDW6A]
MTLADIQNLFKLYKDSIEWNDKRKCWTYDFYHNDVRYQRKSKKWIKSKKYLAEESLLELCENLSTKTPISRMTFEEVFYEYLDFKVARKNTKIGDKRYYDNHVKSILGHLKISEIKVSHLVAFRKEITEKKKQDGSYYDNRSVQKMDSVVKQVFDYAENFDYIDKNLMRRMPPLKTNRPNSTFKRRYTKYEDVLKVLDYLNVPTYRAALAISLYTFMRPAEIFALDFGDDLGDRFTITKSWDSETKQLGPPKNNKERYVAIPHQLRVELDMYYDSLKLYDLQSDTPLIGVTERQSKSSIDKAIKNAISLANVPVFSWYDLRSTMITNMLRSGADAYIVAKNAGHNQAMTTDTYALVDIDEQKELVENMYDNLSSKK